MSMRISIRLNKRVTSVQIRDSVAALYCLINEVPESRSVDTIQDAVYDIAGQWDGDGKGFGSFVTDTLIERMLEGEDLNQFKRIKEVLHG